MDSLGRLSENLRAQQECMLVDDLEKLSELVREQEVLWTECEAYLAATRREGDVADKLAELRSLVETNQLLAQQSLVYARKVLSVLVEEDGYTDSGQKKVRPGKNVDIRA
ncbi:MAG: hypothetical protein DDT20_00380 [Firmicutes bacterium]|nr:hypothetical protein [Bacillota bacterium]